MSDKKENKDILSMSNTAIRKLKKGELESAVIQLKGLLTTAIAANNADALGIELLEAKKKSETDTITISKLQATVGTLRDENKILMKKGSKKARTVLDLNDKLAQYRDDADKLANRGFWATLFNITD